MAPSSCYTLAQHQRKADVKTTTNTHSVTNTNQHDQQAHTRRTCISSSSRTCCSSLTCFVSSSMRRFSAASFCSAIHTLSEFCSVDGCHVFLNKKARDMVHYRSAHRIPEARELYSYAQAARLRVQLSLPESHQNIYGLRIFNETQMFRFATGNNVTAKTTHYRHRNVRKRAAPRLHRTDRRTLRTHTQHCCTQYTEGRTKRAEKVIQRDPSILLYCCALPTKIYRYTNNMSLQGSIHKKSDGIGYGAFIPTERAYYNVRTPTASARVRRPPSSETTRDYRRHNVTAGIDTHRSDISFGRTTESIRGGVVGDSRAKQAIKSLTSGEVRKLKLCCAIIPTTCKRLGAAWAKMV